jgi:hypothetical protein
MTAPRYASAICHQCPECRVWGTFNLYPAIPADDVPERWMCKWCGHYWSERYGVRQCVPDTVAHVWNFRENVEHPGPCPREMGEHLHRWLLHAQAPVQPRAAEETEAKA